MQAVLNQGSSITNLNYSQREPPKEYSFDDHNHPGFPVMDDSPIDEEGVYILSIFKSPLCYNCNTRKTPQWRKGTIKNDLKVDLCNACGIKYHKNQFCSYCYRIYNKGLRNPRHYMVCTCCRRWDHIGCLKQATSSILPEEDPKGILLSYKCRLCSNQEQCLALPKNSEQPISKNEHFYISNTIIMPDML
jgi:hypothetical protein